MELHGGKLAAKALKQAGVECIFTLSGGHIMAIYDGCLDEGIRVIDVRHEQAAVHAADAWSRLNPNKIGCAVLTAGPGVTDGVTGVANAWRANSPILVIGGQGPLGNLRQGSLQEMDHVSVMRPITKWADTCYDTRRIPDYIEMGIRHAVSGNPGPSFLEIPMDVLMGVVEEKDVRFPLIKTKPSRMLPDKEDVREVIKLIKESKTPVMMAGTSVKWSNASKSVQRFVEETHIPTFVNGMGRGTIKPKTKELLNRVRKEAIQKCDLFICAGVLLDFRLNYGNTIPPNAKIVQLDIENKLIGTNRSADASMVGDLNSSFEMLLQCIEEEQEKLDFSSWRDQLIEREEQLEDEFKSQLNSDEVPIDPLRMCREVRDYVEDKEIILIGDGGDIVAQAAKVLPAPAENSWMDPGPLGTLGVGMPFALAAQIAEPDKRVLIIYGDGSFGFNGFEYDTAIRFNLPIVGIVGVDGLWGQIARPQASMYGANQLTAAKLNFTRYDKIVEAMGGHGEYCEKPEEIGPALERAFSSGKAALINVVIRQDIDTGMKGSTYA
ncbi:MAG TPA: thiamine pyrophosphate-binding protein [SAR86 cluster bacterium]|jgi:acetolactate synthase-1/2/3 large subunit|nr:thiamine pyrophosphate-binding protein [SAR86 cluster bacterium]HJM15083.1 thiamine pyrophosphate-binding protein [SAR86 cluster bacterium]HJM59612.1 thiamine pyrophosphate-binding protein [SAR86 cluster bacterium]|tara:strand:- start:6098 stop:7747 length:1650 start_codon:yes stop_codon:yes gene_type:complete